MVIARPGFLVPGPFREWLRRRAQQLGGQQPLAQALGVNERRIRAMLGEVTGRTETGLLNVTTVDRYLTAMGESIAELYGELYELPVPEKDGCGESCKACGLALREPAELCGFCIEERELAA